MHAHFNEIQLVISFSRCTYPFEDSHASFLHTSYVFVCNDKFSLLQLQKVVNFFEVM